MDGGFVWYELSTTDPVAAKDFYAAVAGWTVADANMPGWRYFIARAGDRQVAGVTDLPPNVPRATPVWSGYVGVAGGSVLHPPTDIPGVGRFAVVSDPQGGRFMLFHADGEAPPAVAPGTPGTVAWHELRARDWPAAFAFYEGLFGWTKADAVDMGPMGTYQTFSIDGVWAGGMMDAPEAAPRWLYYIATDDIDAAAARIVAAGGTVTSGPHPVPGGSWVVQATDPQGAAFALNGARRP